MDLGRIAHARGSNPHYSYCQNTDWTWKREVLCHRSSNCVVLLHLLGAGLLLQFKTTLSSQILLSHPFCFSAGIFPVYYYRAKNAFFIYIYISQYKYICLLMADKIFFGYVGAISKEAGLLYLGS